VLRKWGTKLRLCPWLNRPGAIGGVPYRYGIGGCAGVCDGVWIPNVQVIGCAISVRESTLNNFFFKKVHSNKIRKQFMCNGLSDPKN